MTDPAPKDLVTDCVAKGNEAQFADSAWAHELKS